MARGWYVRIVTSMTEASGVELWIGLGGEEGSHRYWRRWNSNEPAEFDLPDDLKHVREIWIKGKADPEGRNVALDVYYNDHITQKMRFDNEEEHETSQDDDD